MEQNDQVPTDEELLAILGRLTAEQVKEALFIIEQFEQYNA